MKVQDIPAMNAALNAMATILMTIAYAQIKSAQVATDPAVRAAKILSHRKLMLSAGGVSAIFLLGYVTHKVMVKGVHTQFGGEGTIRHIYYGMLITHVILAIAIAFLVPKTFILALKGQIDRHKAWAKWTYPIWYYVSVTGVLVYMFLYQWWPAAK